VRVEDTLGRKHAEPEHPYRNPFQRDRDRVIHSRAFRRLENKTQVFTRRFSDHFRNRLTHTIEVAQISRTIAQQLALNQDLVETLALVHDIGHPPFGHAGEKALDAAMRRHGSYFDHNIHALRIVEDFELRYIAFRGLNLTFEVREGIIKHSHDYSAAEYPELSEYLLAERPPLEAQLIDLTDEIAYNTADLDDGYESRILKVPHIREGVRIFDRFYRDIEGRYPVAPEKLKFNEAVKSMLNRLVTDLIENTKRHIAEAGISDVSRVRDWPHRLAAFTDEAEAERRECKEFLYANLYFSEQLKPEKDNAEEVVTELFERLVSNPQALPPSYREKAHSEPVRVVCDYIAGMTDSFVLDQHRKLCGKNRVIA
jgi:dGTPase